MSSQHEIPPLISHPTIFTLPCTATSTVWPLARCGARSRTCDLAQQGARVGRGQLSRRQMKVRRERPWRPESLCWRRLQRGDRRDRTGRSVTAAEVLFPTPNGLALGRSTGSTASISSGTRYVPGGLPARQGGNLHHPQFAIGTE